MLQNSLSLPLLTMCCVLPKKLAHPFLLLQSYTTIETKAVARTPEEWYVLQRHGQEAAQGPGAVENIYQRTWSFISLISHWIHLFLAPKIKLQDFKNWWYQEVHQEEGNATA